MTLFSLNVLIFQSAFFLGTWFLREVWYTSYLFSSVGKVSHIPFSSRSLQTFGLASSQVFSLGLVLCSFNIIWPGVALVFILLGVLGSPKSVVLCLSLILEYSQPLLCQIVPLFFSFFFWYSVQFSSVAQVVSDSLRPHEL